MKKTLLLTTASSILFFTGCLPKELSVNEIDSLHQPYALTEQQVRDIALKGCEATVGGSSMSQHGLTGNVQSLVNVDIVGKIEKTYTNNPLGSTDLVNGAVNMLKGETTAIYKGKCDTTRHTTQNSTYAGGSSHYDSQDNQEMQTVYFIINPKECLNKRNVNRATCFAMDVNPMSVINTLTDGASRIIGLKRDTNSTSFDYTKLYKD
jgi:hypothetical protein